MGDLGPKQGSNMLPGKEQWFLDHISSCFSSSPQFSGVTLITPLMSLLLFSQSLEPQQVCFFSLSTLPGVPAGGHLCFAAPPLPRTPSGHKRQSRQCGVMNRVQALGLALSLEESCLVQQGAHLEANYMSLSISPSAEA